MTVLGRCLRPALAPLRGSTRFAVFGLAAIAIAGCEPRERLPDAHYQCRDAQGREYVGVAHDEACPSIDVFYPTGERLAPETYPEGLACKQIDGPQYRDSCIRF